MSQLKECDICCEEIPTNDEVKCRHCSHAYHWTCLYQTYQTQRHDILNGRCPYCTQALPIAMRIHLSDKDINAWLMTTIERDDAVYAFTDRRTLARTLCDSSTRANMTSWKFDKPSCVNVRLETFEFYAMLSEDKKYPEFATAAKSIIESEDKLLVAFYRVFGRNVPEVMNNEECRRLMEEYLKLVLVRSSCDESVIRNVENNICPKCDQPLDNGFCKNCLHTYNLRTISFVDMKRHATIVTRVDARVEELQAVRSLQELCFDLDRLTTNEANTLIDGMTTYVDKHSDELFTALSTNGDASKSSKKLIESVHKMNALLKEALVPLALSTLELTAQAAIFVPLERKRAIARHAYLHSACCHLAMGLYDAYRAMHAEHEDALEHLSTEAIHTLEDVEEELLLVDELIIKNSLETIIAKHQK